MTPEHFCYWLQGMLEGNSIETLDSAQVQIIRDHLNTVFVKVTPDRSEKRSSSGTYDKALIPYCTSTYSPVDSALGPRKTVKVC